MRSPENEAVVLAMWADYDRDGLTGILRWAAEDAEWRPHSAEQSVFRSTADYRAYVEEAIARGVHVDSIRLGIWSQGEVVAVRGAPARAPGRRRSTTRACTGCTACGTARSAGPPPPPTSAACSRRPGCPAAAITNEAFMAMHDDQSPR